MSRQSELLVEGFRTLGLPPLKTFQLCLGIFALLLLGGCSSYGKTVNTPVDSSNKAEDYSIVNFHERHATDGQIDDIDLILAFSGGGTRAAALAYGIMEELRDTQIISGGQQIRLLDEVDSITSVSGGSFAAAYYGLHGEKFFDIFEEEFLHLNMNKALGRKLMNPVLWFSRKGRTESAVEYYEKMLFHGATFADMNKPGRPLIVINTSDLSHGVRFSFLQEYFGLLCSDLASFPIARAVAASSAVPVLFNPIVIENHDGCGTDQIHWPEDIDERRRQNEDLNDLYNGLETYRNKKERRYIHFVDGGITDNMGLRAVHDIVQIAGGADDYLRKSKQKLPKKVVVISVNASTNALPEMDKSPKQPSMLDSMNAMSSVQLHRYNSATIEVLESNMERWAEDVSTPEATVKSYFIPVSFEDVDQPQLKLFLNKIPTSFGLEDEQVDALIESGRTLVRNNPEFKRLLSDLAQDQRSP